jgi:cell division protein FtsI (penicillin-binding protein 3)
MDVKNEVLYRVYFLLFGVVAPVAILLLYRTVDIAIVQGPKWRERAQDNYIKPKAVEAERGNIYSADGSLLATSVPFFDIYFDPLASSDEDFAENLDSLAYCMATFVDNTYTVGGYRERLLQMRDDTTHRYVLIKRKVPYAEKRRIENFPLFNLGRYRSGFIAEKRSERKRPFGLLAQRTIGYVREGVGVGLDGYFDHVLGGKAGTQMMICVDEKRDIWLPLEDLTEIEPRSGNDIVTTLDINIQDITEEALLRAMNHHDAGWGVAIVMEVKTGAVKAMANLGKTNEGWWETYNHAVGTGSEPGSTFKLASIMALLEDGHVRLDDSIFIQKGETEFYDQTMVDASPDASRLDTTTVRRAFQISSNVAIAKLVTQYYGNRENKAAEKFIQRLKDFNLHLPTGIEVEGEAKPYIKEAYSAEDQWSGTSLPWMSIGYELTITPLQLLTFFNAVANDGMMMKPYLVSEIQHFGETIESFKPTVVKRRIASAKTIARAQELLELVVEDGTAYKLKTDRYRFAGKTGTAQINYRKNNRGIRVGGYQASFVGYFPADDPVYSCIVVLNNPRQNGFYGADVAGPVFREIADKCYMSNIALHQALNVQPKPALGGSMLPHFDAGNKEDIATIMRYLDIPFYGEPETEMAVLIADNDSLLMEPRSTHRRLTPNVVGMGLRDALYILENQGLKVQISGVGKVIRQSLKPGTRARGQTIYLTLG